MEALSVQAVLGLIGLVILLGLAGEVFLKQTGVPSVLFLVGFGILLGPVFGFVDPDSIQVVAPYFGTLALLIILFDGGLNLHLTKVLKETPIALLFTFVVFSISVILTGAFYAWVLQKPWLHGLLLGSILGGTAASIVMPVVTQLTTISDSVKVMVTLESAVVNVFVIVVALALIGVLSDQTEQSTLARGIFHAFLYALLLAAVAGALWARLLTWLKGQPLSYMLTLAAILVLYNFAEFLGANGAMTILWFGLVLGNMETLVGHLARPIRRVIGYELDQANFELDTFLKRLNEELSFLVRTFFYVLLGLILNFSALTWLVALGGITFFALALGARWMVTEVFARAGCGWTRVERRVIISMLPRGLATAVMAFLPAHAGLPGTELFPMYALTVIALSVVYMTIALAMERRRAPEVVTTMPL